MDSSEVVVGKSYRKTSEDTRDIMEKKDVGVLPVDTVEEDKNIAKPPVDTVEKDKNNINTEHHSSGKMEVFSIEMGEIAQVSVGLGA